MKQLIVNTYSTGFARLSKKLAALFVVAMLMTLGSQASLAVSKSKVIKPFNNMSKESATCASCHKKENPSLYQQWGRSKHFGANVGCYECHKADAADADAIRHKDFMISVIVSPKDCANCHTEEVKQFSESKHSNGAASIEGSDDHFLAEMVEGAMTFNNQSPMTVSGCWQCHGSKVKVLPNGDLDPTTWPNTGIGRINPDGSKGACTACHQRHEFSLGQARRPESCGSCHLGPNHPQKEIYDQSKHGINFYANQDKMNLDSAKWVAGEDYDAAPTCATCHMSATTEFSITHNTGERISWNLRLPVSEKVDSFEDEEAKPWLLRRKDMKGVCKSCHSANMVNNFYEQFDAVVNLYNGKFAQPGVELMKALKEGGLLTEMPFDEAIEWTWFYLWHHEGRRARQGASMQAPDYTQWHGMAEVSRRFYTEMVPQVKALIEKGQKSDKPELKAGAEKVRQLLDEILNRDEHKWFLGKMSEEMKAHHATQREQFKKRYLPK
ncbi:multiheme c-type cytochrome [Candidatus Parabeggiatoa sp. HSG14]|uniref:multiheme c-type cytochrome n=1 Tax=Candidatus Parabeggiatoa sp. HSG14 TaxID=3055593 RepID=UPI0025A745F5|nr:multiheme c-type cytochrome [Thiotrichales bacterium HSG14]